MGDGWMLARPREGVNGEVRSDAPRVDVRDVPRLELHASPATQRRMPRGSIAAQHASESAARATVLHLHPHPFGGERGVGVEHEFHEHSAPQRDALLAFGDEERPRPPADSLLGVREGVRRRHNPAAACVSSPHCPSAVSVERVRWNALTASVASMPGRA